MTIKLLTDWPYKRANNAGYVTMPAGAVVGVFDAATETAMIASKLAAASAAAPDWFPPSDAGRYDELLPAEVPTVRALVSGDGYPAGGGGSALPFVMPSSGTVASTGGSINSMTGLNYNPGPAYLYFPAGALFAASPAGWYFFVYGGATFGTVYANVYTNGIPRIPDSPTPLITVAGAFTQATVVDVMGPTYVVPANTLGPNGYIRWSRLYECLNNANPKACNVYFGGSLFQGAALASTSRRGSVGYIRNRGSAVRNIGANGADGDTGTPAAYTRFTVDTTQAQTFSIALRLDVATDWAMIEGHSVELFRAA